MNLADKNCYPYHRDYEGEDILYPGLTFRERLIVALAGSALTRVGSPDKDAKIIIAHADAIIKQLEEGQK